MNWRWLTSWACSSRPYGSRSSRPSRPSPCSGPASASPGDSSSCRPWLTSPRVSTALPERTAGYVRSVHPYAYKSGEWAQIIGHAVRLDGRPLWLLVWPDGATDEWVADDPDGGYEFRL